jgi:hypothetical protein
MVKEDHIRPITSPNHLTVLDLELGPFIFFSAGQSNRNALHKSVGLRPSAVSSWASTENPAQRKFHAKLIRTAVPIQS